VHYLLFRLPFQKFFLAARSIYISDGQLAARGLIYSGPRQVSGLFSKILTTQL
jgi:hypothetical protein